MGSSNITIAGLFLEGLLSFFSPCVLPLLPLYIGYLTAGFDRNDPNHRLHTFLNTLAFVLGICTVFVVAGLGSSALRSFFQTYTLQFQLFGGFLLLVLGLMSLGVIQIPFLQKDYRINVERKEKTSFLQAYIMGFCFSFAWSPCIGPLLASAIVAAASAPGPFGSLLYLGAYSLGFIIPFLAVGLFADTLLTWFKDHKNIVRYTGILGGLIVTGMGIYMLVQANRTILIMQGNPQQTPAVVSSEAENSTAVIAEGETEKPEISEDEVDAVKYNFTLKDASGNEHQLKDYIGKPLLLNFFGTWCTYCNKELPDLQKVADQGDVQVVLIATPHFNGEGDIEYVESFMKDSGYNFTILYDDQLEVTRTYGINGYPTTFAMKKDGSFLGYMPGYMPSSMLEEIVADLQKD